MKRSKSRLTQGFAFACAAIMFSLVVRAEAQTYTTLANFNGTNGRYPYYGSMIQSTNGNYYGVTDQGGANTQGCAFGLGCGAVFEITPSGNLTDLYGFCALTNCADGDEPWSSIVLGSDGNFYGTTGNGGTNSLSGTIFKVTRGGKLTTLYTFCTQVTCVDGSDPVGLTEASNGNFYGATYAGGTGVGTIFEITKTGSFRTLYSFCSQNCTDGYHPLSGPMQAKDGALYGTTVDGGANGEGSIYKITTSGQFKTIYSFCGCADGSNPVAGLTQDAHGNFYGTTEDGGIAYGTVFEFTTSNQMITLHIFNGTDGAYPVAPLIQANDGNLYGTTRQGGIDDAGTLYKVSATGEFTPLRDFCTASSCTGLNPLGPLMQATNGTLYGTTANGGSSDSGTVFSYSLGLGPLVETVPVAGKVGKRVIILGDGLTGSTSVTFNGTAAAFTVVSDTFITATVPAGATTGTLSVATPTGTLSSNPAFRVTK